MSTVNGQLTGRVAIVTGAAQGMGEGFARALHAAGASVVVSDINDDLGKAVAASLGARATYVHHDVSRWESWLNVIAAAEHSHGPVGVLVNNAGIAWFASVEDSAEDATRRLIDVDQMGVFLGMKAVIPSMRKAGGGSIVNIASAVALKGIAGLAVYASCKWAVRGMTKCAALELGKDRIRVNAVHPGMIDTALTQGMADPASAPIPRKGSVAEVAKTVLFLACEESAYTTGCDFTVDGGLTIACD